MIGQGLIQAVRIATAGSYLAADAALAATSLVLESVLDFSTDGGQLTLNGVTYTYTAANYDTGTLTLSTGLTGAALTVDRVDVSPLSTEKLALVTTAGPGDAVSARIPHALVDRVPEGIREPGDEESVQYSLDNGEFVITDVVGRTPAIGAEYVPEINDRFPITETDIADGAISTPKLTANAIDGMTITGVLLRSATSSVGRVEIGEDPLQPASTDTEMRIYSADPDETESAAFSGGATTPGNFLAQAKGFSTALTSAPKLLLRTDSTEGAAEIEADRFSVFATTADFGGTLAVTGALTKSGVPVVTTTATQTLTNKDLSSGTNTLPTSVATLTGSQTLTNKDLTSGNTFPTSLATLTGTQTLTNKDLTASTNTFLGKMLTQVPTAACSAGVALTSTEVDITGATVTFSTTRANATYVCTGSFYFSANAANTAQAFGKLSVDGTVQTTFAGYTGANTVPDRCNGAQTWTGTLASAGSHTLKLRGVLAGTGVTVNQTHTTITVMVFE